MDDGAADLIGRVLDGRYRLERTLGSGGMGSVYEAVQLDLNRRVAVKVLHAALAHDDTSLMRFRREAEAASALSHPNVVPVTGFGTTEDGLAYIVMELVDGKSLQEILHERGKLPVERAVPIIAQVLAVLEVAHQHGIVHRDLKPANVMVQNLIGAGDYVQLVDFGIALLTRNDDERLTQAGVAIGTPAYMAPEQIVGQDVDARTDVYGAGVLMYCALTGERPFSSKPGVDLYSQIVVHTAPRVSGVPTALADVVACALEKSPSSRYQSAAQMIEALAPWLPNASALLRTGPTPAADSGRDLATNAERPAPKAADDPTVRPGPSKDVASRGTGDARAGATRAGARARAVPEEAEAVTAAPGRRSLPADTPAPPSVASSSHSVADAPVAKASARPAPSRPIGAMIGAALIAAAVVAGVMLLVFNADRIFGADGAGASDPPPMADGSDRAGVQPLQPVAMAPVEPGAAVVDEVDASSAGAAVDSEPDAAAATALEADEPEPAGPPPTGPGTVRVTSDPWAHVAVDGSGRGQTPLTLRLSPGPHTIALQTPTGLRVNKHVMVRPGGRHRVRHVF